MHYDLTLSSTFYNSSHYWERLSPYSIYLSDLDRCRCWYALYTFGPISIRSLLPIELAPFLLGCLHFSLPSYQGPEWSSRPHVSVHAGHSRQWERPWPSSSLVSLRRHVTRPPLLIEIGAGVGVTPSALRAYELPLKE